MRRRVVHWRRPTDVYGGARANKAREQAWARICDMEFGSLPEIDGIPLAEALRAQEFGASQTAEELLGWVRQVQKLH
jgi:hypothetical protein